MIPTGARQLADWRARAAASQAAWKVLCAVVQTATLDECLRAIAVYAGLSEVDTIAFCRCTTLFRAWHFSKQRRAVRTPLRDLLHNGSRIPFEPFNTPIRRSA